MKQPKVTRTHTHIQNPHENVRKIKLKTVGTLCNIFIERAGNLGSVTTTYSVTHTVKFLISVCENNF